MAISNQMLSSTTYSVMEEETDLLFKTCPLLDLLEKNKGTTEDTYGTKILEPVSTNTHSVLTALNTGAEEMNLTARDPLNRAEFEPADFGGPIFISRTEELANAGDKQVIALAEALTRAVMSGSRRQINLQLIAGADPVAVAAGLNTLNGHAAGGLGFIEGRTPATQSNTVGGLAKATTGPGWRNQFADCGGTFAAGGKAAMDSVAIACRTKGLFGAPNIVLASATAFKGYNATLFAGERWGPKDDLDGGRMSLMYGSAVVEPEDDMPTHATPAFAPGMLFLNSKAVQIRYWKGGKFELIPFQQMTGSQLGRIAYVSIKMQLVVKHLASLGQVGGVTG